MDDFRGAIREDVQKGKSAINEGLLYWYHGYINLLLFKRLLFEPREIVHRRE